MNKLSFKNKIYMLCAGIILIAIAIHLIFEGVHGVAMYAVFGFIGAWFYIILGKKILAKLLQRDENYYDGGEDNE